MDVITINWWMCYTRSGAELYATLICFQAGLLCCSGLPMVLDCAEASLLFAMGWLMSEWASMLEVMTIFATRNICSMEHGYGGLH